MSAKSKSRRHLPAIVFIFLQFLSTSLFAQDAGSATPAQGEELNAEMVAAGETLFNNNCKVCHAVHSKVLGPPLANVYERRPIEWIKSFVRNSQQVIESGDEYAVNLFNEYNKTMMTPFDFSDEEILSIIEYIKSETLKGPPVEEKVTVAATETTVQEQGISSGLLITFLVILLIILVLILVVLFVLVSVLTKYLKLKAELSAEDKEIVYQELEFGKFIKSPGFVWVATFILTAFIFKAVIDGLYNVGIQQGYAPTQPIAFSHKVHAGDFKIDCNYCHTGVRKSRNANLPSVNICMNCHVSINKVTGATEPSMEIQKIYDANENNMPIEWVRVHNLPDLAYFNHAQHFEVGGITCQTCHGTVEEMDVLRQQENLTMGWCIDCHRKTEIRTDNGYYDKLVKIHAEKSDKPMVVEDIGGLECSKCHY